MARRGWARRGLDAHSGVAPAVGTTWARHGVARRDKARPFKAGQVTAELGPASLGWPRQGVASPCKARSASGGVTPTGGTNRGEARQCPAPRGVVGRGPAWHGKARSSAGQGKAGTR